MCENKIRHLKVIEGEPDEAIRTARSVARLMGALIDNMPPSIEGKLETDKGQNLPEDREIAEALQNLKREREVYLRRRQMRLVK